MFVSIYVGNVQKWKDAMQTSYTPYSLDKVRLTPSLFKDRFELNTRYVNSLKAENLLSSFYQEAGLTFHITNGAFRVTEYGVKNAGDDRHWGWESPTCEIRGHFVGHWLSAAARIIQATGNAEIKIKADFIVDEIARCQAKNGGGWAGSIPEKYFRLTAEGMPTWAPQYVAHKTLMGLYEMYTLAGNAQALEIIDGFADWFVRWTDPFSREQMDDILDVETGGMLEVWADLYSEIGEAKYLTLVECYTRARLFDPLLAGKDVLTNMHANTTIPEIHGAARAYEVTGDERWRRIVEAYWKSAVTDRGTFATGGQTSGEIWTPPFEFSARLGSRTQEHCSVYNMIRLADYLFRWTGDAAYADYIERNLYNGILAQQNPQTGMVAYTLPLEAGATKVWGSETNDFWCCHGSLVQAQSIHNAYVYYQDADGVVLCQYIPTVLETEWGGSKVTIAQKNLLTTGETPGALHRPQSWRIGVMVTCAMPTEFTLKLRLPEWLSGAPTVTVNGDNVPIPADAAGFFALRRVWSNDSITIELPKRIAAIPLPDAPAVYAFADGPVVLAGLCDEERMLVGDIEDVESFIVPHEERQWGNWMPFYRTQRQAHGLRFKPLYEVTDERYTVYFPVQPPA